MRGPARAWYPQNRRLALPRLQRSGESRAPPGRSSLAWPSDLFIPPSGFGGSAAASARSPNPGPPHQGARPGRGKRLDGRQHRTRRARVRPALESRSGGPGTSDPALGPQFPEAYRALLSFPRFLKTFLCPNSRPAGVEDERDGLRPDPQSVPRIHSWRTRWTQTLYASAPWWVIQNAKPEF